MRATVMGIVNVTPDSFFDGGRYFDHSAAIARGEAMLEEGAAVVDVGGESTRPGAEPVAVEEELRRTVPVVAALARSGRVSIDTSKPEVARAAVEAGATLINDVTSTLAPTAAELGVGIVLMHMRGTPRTMQRDPHYDDVVTEVGAYLSAAAAAARGLGVEEVYVDPGIGFGKRARDNLALLAELPRLVARGTPVLVGTSRKSILGTLAAGPDGVPLPPEARFEASVATAAWSLANGAAMVRVHDVGPVVMAARLLDDSHLALRRPA